MEKEYLNKAKLFIVKQLFGVSFLGKGDRYGKK